MIERYVGYVEYVTPEHLVQMPLGLLMITRKDLWLQLQYTYNEPATRHKKSLHRQGMV